MNMYSRVGAADADATRRVFALPVPRHDSWSIPAFARIRPALPVTILVYGAILAALYFGLLAPAGVVHRHAPPTVVTLLPLERDNPPETKPLPNPPSVAIPQTASAPVAPVTSPATLAISEGPPQSGPAGPPSPSSIATPADSKPAPGLTSPAPAVTPIDVDLALSRNPAPSYPPLARKAGQHGTVVLRLRVGADGRVDAVEIARSSGTPALDRAARDAVARWSFSPAKLGDRAVEAWAIVPISFAIG